MFNIKRFSNLTNRRGFTMMEIMVTVAILAIVAMASMHVTDQLLQSTAGAERMQSLQILQDKIRQTLTYQSLCEAAIGPASGLNQGTIVASALTAGTQQISMSIPGIRSGPSLTGTVIGANTYIYLYKLKIDSMTLVDVRNFAPGNYVAQIVVNTETLTGQVLPPISSTVEFVVSGSSISDCLGLSSTLDSQTCVSMGCVWNTLATPSCQCDPLFELCPYGSFPTGFSGGHPNCVSLTTSCGAGSYMTGMSLTGATCVTLP